MKTVFATFNFKSTDVAGADKLYLETHVRLTLQLPNLRRHPHRRASHRAAFDYFDDEAALLITAYFSDGAS
jgi:hypothetical protein